MCRNLDGILFASIRFPCILEISQYFLLFRVNRYRWLIVLLDCYNSLGDELKLSIAIRMLVAFDGLAIRLKAISSCLKKLTNLDTAHLESLPLEFNSKRLGTFACPA